MNTRQIRVNAVCIDKKNVFLCVVRRSGLCGVRLMRVIVNVTVPFDANVRQRQPSRGEGWLFL